MARLPFALAAVMTSLLFANVASAQFFEDDEEEDKVNPIAAWAIDGSNRFSVGLNGVLTAPADPVMFAIEGNDVFESLPASEYTGRGIGFLAGLCQMPYRMLMGSFDMAVSWMPFLYMQSPLQRFTLFPWMEHDEG